MFNNCREIAVSNFHIFHALISTRFRCDLCIWAYAEHAFCVNASLSTNEDRNQTGCITCNTCLLNHLPVEPTKSVLMRPSMHCISNAFRIFVRLLFLLIYHLRMMRAYRVALLGFYTYIFWRSHQSYSCNCGMMNRLKYDSAMSSINDKKSTHMKKKWDSRMTHTLRSKMRTDKK